MTSTESPRVSWRDVSVDGARVRLMEAGPETGDPLLFLHGWGLSAATYADGVARLTRTGVRVIAPCLPGFGGSDGLGLREIELPAYARRLGRLVDVLEIDTPVFVAGHSFGAGVALQLATDRPDLVRALTLVSSVGGAPGRRSGLVDASWARWAAGFLGELGPREVARSAPSVLKAFLPNLLRNPVTLALTARVALTASLADQAAALVARGLPVLFFWGDDDRLIVPGTFGGVSAELPAQMVHGRHGWLLSHPEDFAAVLGDALVVLSLLERRSPAAPGHDRRPPRALVLPAGLSLADLLAAR